MRTCKRWTDEEVARMISMVRTTKIRDVAAALGRENRSVDSKILELRRSGIQVITLAGGKCPPGFKKIDRPWSDREVKRLLSLVGQLKIREAAEQLGRNFTSVSAKINDLRLHGVTVVTLWKGRPWNAIRFTSEIQKWTIEAVRAGKPNREIADHLGVGLSSVHRLLVKLGLNHFRFRIWTPEEDEKLRSMAGDLVSREIAEALGRTYLAVRARARALNLSVAVRVQRAAPRPRAPRTLKIARMPKIEKPSTARRGRAPRERGSLTPPERPGRRYCVDSVNWCAHCNAPFVDTLGGRQGHFERLGHRPAGRAA